MRGFVRDVRGEVGVSHAMLLAAVALAGTFGFGALGHGFNDAIGGSGSTGVPVAVQAASGEDEVALQADALAGTPPSAVTRQADALAGANTSAQAGGTTPIRGAGTSTENPSTWDKYLAASSDCGLNPSCRFREAGNYLSSVQGLGPVYNFVTNFGMNPGAWIADPIGQAGATWNRIWGIGEFAVSTVYSVGKVGYEANAIFNPVSPAFWIDVYQNGWDKHVDRANIIVNRTKEVAPGVGEFLWSSSNPKIAYECITGGADHCQKYIGDRVSEGWNNPVVQSIVKPFGDCAGEAGSDAAEDACGHVAGDVILTVATSGFGKGASGARVTTEALVVGEEGLDDVARIGTKAAGLSDDAERAAAGGVEAAGGSEAENAARLAAERRPQIVAQDDALLVRDPHGENQLDNAYRAAHADARGQFSDWLGSGEEITPESLATELKSQHANLATEYKGTGSNEIAPGEFNAGFGRSTSGPGQLDVPGTLEQAGFSPEEIAQATDPANYAVKVRDIPDNQLPANAVGLHVYPGGTRQAYIDAAAQRLESIRTLAPTDPRYVTELADYYHTLANARMFGQVNNSLLMDEVNAMLIRSGRPGIPHGLLDHAALSLDYQSFERVFQAALEGKITWRPNPNPVY